MGVRAIKTFLKQKRENRTRSIAQGGEVRKRQEKVHLYSKYIKRGTRRVMTKQER